MIKTNVPESEGWWADRLASQVTSRARRIDLLTSYIDGNAPLPEGAEGCREAYRAFQRKSRTNFGEIIVEAVQERMTVTGYRIGGDESLESVAARYWSINEMDSVSADVHADMLTLGCGVVIVGPPEAASRWDWSPGRRDERIPVITRENPAQMAVEYDPQNDKMAIAAVKLYRDDIAGEDVAYLYLPGRVRVARRKSSCGERMDIGAFEWTEETRLPYGVMPVVAFENRRCMGEFETHTDLLDRINFMVLQRLVITSIQAFKQRAIEGEIPETDEDGNPIDYGGVFRPGPGALWMLPDGVHIWESGSTDIQPLLTGVKDDIRDLAACTRTPMSMLLPDSQNQSAEGASFAREGLVFKAKDRIRRASYGWNQVMQLALLFGGHEWQRDVETLWLPPERLSLSERADASSKATDLPFGTKLRKIWGFSEGEAERIEQERLDDTFLTAIGEPTQDGNDV